MLLRLCILLLFVNPSLMFSQFDSWIDGKRLRFTHGYGPFMTEPLWSTSVGIEHWEGSDPKDIQWGVGGRISYMTDDIWGAERVFRIGERDFSESLVLSFNYTVGANLFYVYDDTPGFSGRFRIEVPLGIEAVFGGGEKLTQLLPIIDNGSVVGETPIWHKEGIALIRPSLGLNFTYTHSLSPNIAIGTHSGFVGILGIGAYFKGGIVLEIRAK